MNRVIIILLAAFCTLPAMAHSTIVQNFMPVCDSLSALLEERTGVEGKLELKAVMKRGNSLDFYFTESLGDWPWHTGDEQWFRGTLKELFPESYAKYRLGEVYSRRVSLKRLVMPHLGFNGIPADSRHRIREPHQTPAIVRSLDGMSFDKGLDGRHIALWQSHGRYYEYKFQRWEWQRPCLFQTAEDMFTQGFVLPFLVPMLENAGAYVMLPRERDTRREECVVDNDPTWDRNQATFPFGYGENGPVRGSGTYEETGSWSDGGTGFADTLPVYAGDENPFGMGTFRTAGCISHNRKGTAPEAIWRPDIPEDGRYAVYVSYRSLPKSTSSAAYSVVHRAGVSRFAVNQKMGGGTWIYLGTFEFEKGNSGYVKLEARTPKGHKHENGCIVSADAVRFGGGMGCIARGDEASGISVSGMARSAEAARYYLQWAGADTTVFSQNGGRDDYKDDFMCRGDWVGAMSGGSRVNPDKEGGRIPFDLSFGFHSDAGVTPNDSIIGTLAIYTYRSEGKTAYPGGEDRMTSREYADIVQSQLTNDLQGFRDSLWSRRSTWDRAYRESRTPPVPAMILELLSHQNFADMKHGLDPSFRFMAARAVYKGMLKYLSNRYGRPYAVQPLPVRELSASFEGNGKAVISWKKTDDPLEPTAQPSGYILYTRTDDGPFDKGITVRNPERSSDRLSVTMDIQPGHVYSFRISAFNDGGISFPSETMSIGLPKDGGKGKTVLIVNNFDRVSGPAFIDTPEYAGFLNGIDSGVPYMEDITFVGEMHQFRRGMQWTDDDNPGFGASYSDRAGFPVKGNTFDYPYTHGKAILSAGYPFISCSNDAFCSSEGLTEGIWAIDMICGKQVTTPVGSGSHEDRFRVFPAEIRQAVTEAASKGINLIVSGANIGTDIYDRVYEGVQTDSTERAEGSRFAEKVLGYRWMTGFGGRTAQVKTLEDGKTASFCNTQDGPVYCVETPDGIIPSSGNGRTVMRYKDTGISAGTYHQGEGYRSACFGFPLETLLEESDLKRIMGQTLQFFEK